MFANNGHLWMVYILYLANKPTCKELVVINFQTNLLQRVCELLAKLLQTTCNRYSSSLSIHLQRVFYHLAKQFTEIANHLWRLFQVKGATREKMSSLIWVSSTKKSLTPPPPKNFQTFWALLGNFWATFSISARNFFNFFFICLFNVSETLLRIWGFQQNISRPACY